MCCNSTREKNRAFIKEIKAKHGHADVFIPVYKGVEKRNGKLVSPVHTYFWNVGLHQVKTKLTPAQLRNKNGTYEGIYVYLKEKDVGYGDRTIKLYALASSLLGTNGNHAVFSTVLLTEDELKKGLRAEVAQNEAVY